MVSALDQITGALRLIGQLAEGETASSETANDSLTAMNQMIDSWNTERLSVFSTQDQVFTWPSNEATRTLGPTGDFVGNRPIQVDDSTYFRDTGTGISYGVKIINEQQYNGIAVKDVTSTFPQVLWVNYDFENISMSVFPVPTQALEWHIVSVAELSQPATLATALAFPPGYLRAFRYNLACEIAAEFGVEPSPQVMRIAMTSKRNLKRINNPDNIMSMPYPLIKIRGRFNVYSGQF